MSLNMILLFVVNIFGTLKGQYLLTEDKSLTIQGILYQSTSYTESMTEQLLMRRESNYILYDDMQVLISKLHFEFPEILTISSIGLTFE